MVMEMSKTYQYRKVMKPLLERKRRARINKCLDDLKDLMVECLQQEGEHVTRLEKADILELTVEHMRKLKQRGTLSLQPVGAVHPLSTAATATAHVESFRSGYVHAADQISQVLLQQRQTDEVGCKIMKFLSGRLIEMQHHLLRTTTSTPSSDEAEPTASSASAAGPTEGQDTIVDVTTIEANSNNSNSAWTDSGSVHSVDSSCSGSEPMWRPW